MYKEITMQIFLEIITRENFKKFYNIYPLHRQKLFRTHSVTMTVISSICGKLPPTTKTYQATVPKIQT